MARTVVRALRTRRVVAVLVLACLRVEQLVVDEHGAEVRVERGRLGLGFGGEVALAHAALYRRRITEPKNQSSPAMNAVSSTTAMSTMIE